MIGYVQYVVLARICLLRCKKSRIIGLDSKRIKGIALGSQCLFKLLKSVICNKMNVYLHDWGCRFGVFDSSR